MSRVKTARVSFNDTRKTPSLDPFNIAASRVEAGDSTPVSLRISKFSQGLIREIIDAEVFNIDSTSDFIRAAVDRLLAELGDNRKDLPLTVKDGCYRLKVAIRQAAARAESTNVNKYLELCVKNIRHYMNAGDLTGAARAWLESEAEIDNLLSPAFKEYAIGQLYSRGDLEAPRERAMEMKVNLESERPRMPAVLDSSEEG